MITGYQDFTKMYVCVYVCVYEKEEEAMEGVDESA